MNEFVTRRAEKKDCSMMMELIKELALYEKAPEQVTVDFDHFVDSGFGIKPVWWAFVAEDKSTGNVVGMALYYIRYSTWKGQRMYLEDIVVRQAFRGKGLGKLLLDACLAEARQQNWSGVSWQVLDWNEPAIKFYEKYNAGFDGEWINCTVELN